jgi:hypothetical protein
MKTLGVKSRKDWPQVTIIAFDREILSFPDALFDNISDIYCL